MKIVSWNVRGLGNRNKNFMIKDVLSKAEADIVIIQETEMQHNDRRLFAESGAAIAKVGSSPISAKRRRNIVIWITILNHG